MSQNDTQNDLSETEYLRLAVDELNQSIAYLSKMVLQLQRSVNAQKPGQQKTQSSEKPQPKDPPVTVH